VLDGVCEGNMVEIVFAGGAALEDEPTPVGHQRPLGRSLIAGAERLVVPNGAEPIMTEHLFQLPVIEMGSASGHTDWILGPLIFLE
jgi:hypothetical protein